MQNNKIRSIILGIILSLGIGLSIVIYFDHVKAPLGPTLSPLLQTAGQVPLTFDRLVTKVVQVNDLDEKEFGEVIKSKILLHTEIDDTGKNREYLAGFSETLNSFAQKPFKYDIIFDPSRAPNAYALPGGTILVTRGMLNTLESESQLVAVLAHEMGHIELGHCLQAVKFQIAADKIGATSLGELADMTISLLARHSFSKTQENEADEYGYDLLLQTQYDPNGFGQAFEQLNKSHGEKDDTSLNPIRDYLRSHPPLALRIDKFSNKANECWNKNEGNSRYIGVKNLNQRTRFSSEANFEEEWVKIKTRHDKEQ